MWSAISGGLALLKRLFQLFLLAMAYKKGGDAQREKQEDAEQDEAEDASNTLHEMENRPDEEVAAILRGDDVKND